MFQVDIIHICNTLTMKMCLKFMVSGIVQFCRGEVEAEPLKTSRTTVTASVVLVASWVDGDLSQDKNHSWVGVE